MMAKTLVVVESPAKAKTIKKYLGAGYDVVASKGHIKDLPKKMGVDMEHGFKETYEIIPAKEKDVSELKGAAKGATEVLLATDPDREGEAIAWHVAEELGRDTKEAASGSSSTRSRRRGSRHGVANPRELDKHLYDAQRARRVLDRIVGYDVSALVWNKLAFGLSAGRVQSVALRLIVDREREIEAFVPEEYWNVRRAPSPPRRDQREPEARPRSSFASLVRQGGQEAPGHNGDAAGDVKADLQTAAYKVAKVKKSERKRNAPAPYTHEQAPAGRGRTDWASAPSGRCRWRRGSTRGSTSARSSAAPSASSRTCAPTRCASRPRRWRPRASTSARRTATHVPETPNTFKSKKGAQDAHEAIRPTSLELTPERVRKHLKDEQFKLYKLIWNRFLASQMTDAVYDQTTAISKRQRRQRQRVRSPRVSGRVLKFAGWLEAYGVRGAERDEAEARRRGRRHANTEPENGGAPATARRAAMPGEPTRDAPRAGRRRSAHAGDSARRRSRSRSSRSRRPRYNEGLARARARGARHRAPEHVRETSSARCRRATTSSGSTAEEPSVRRLSASSSSTVWCRASSTSWSRRSRRAWKKSSMPWRRAQRSAWSFSRGSTRASERSSTPARKESGGPPSRMPTDEKSATSAATRSSTR